MIKLADRRLVTNISTVGTSGSGISIYQYEFIDCGYGCGLFLLFRQDIEALTIRE